MKKKDTKTYQDIKTYADSFRWITIVLPVIALVVSIIALITGCGIIEGMPRVQGVIGNVVTVQVNGQEALIFEPASPDISPTFALVPPVKLDKGERFAIYDNGPRLSVIVNGEERVQSDNTKLYYLGTAGISMEYGWNYYHVLPKLEKQLKGTE